MTSGILGRLFPSRHRGVTLTGVLVIGALALVALLAPWIVPGSPTEIAKDHALRPPTLAQPFGMDDLGRSILSRVAHAYRSRSASRWPRCCWRWPWGCPWA